MRVALPPAKQMLLTAVAVLLMVGVVRVQGQSQSPSLAELARKEQERRKTVKTPAKAITKKDLPASAQNPPPQAAPAPAAPAKSDESKPPENKPDEKDEAWWKNRINQVREELRRNEMFAEALQTRINSLSSDFVNRDDPFQRAKIGEDRDKALAELSRVKAEMVNAKKHIEDIEEEARKAGVPPGWLR
jgi:chromosome segregation ATPase